MITELIIELHFLVRTVQQSDSAGSRLALSLEHKVAPLAPTEPNPTYHISFDTGAGTVSPPVHYGWKGTQGTCLLVLLSAVSNDWEQRGSWEKAQDWKGWMRRGKDLIGDHSTYWPTHWKIFRNLHEKFVWFKWTEKDGCTNVEICGYSSMKREKCGRILENTEGIMTACFGFGIK